MKRYKFYTLYQVTNNINGRVYVGCHRTNDLNDGYMGSGKILKQAIEKYGVENFTKKILQKFDSAEEMFEAESSIVTEEFISRDNTYNIKEGGSGGGVPMPRTDETKERMRIAQTGRKHPKEARQKMSAKKKGRTWEEIYGVEEAERKRAALHQRNKERYAII